MWFYGKEILLLFFIVGKSKLIFSVALQNTCLLLPFNILATDQFSSRCHCLHTSWSTQNHSWCDEREMPGTTRRRAICAITCDVIPPAVQLQIILALLPPYHTDSSHPACCSTDTIWKSFSTWMLNCSSGFSVWLNVCTGVSSAWIQQCALVLNGSRLNNSAASLKYSHYFLTFKSTWTAALLITHVPFC